MYRSNVIVSAVFIGMLLTGCQSPPPKPPVQVQQSSPLSSVSESHILGNEPTQTNFDTFLKRDLTAYFTKSFGKPVVVTYEFLRNAPTQSGVSYPKYYLWVKMQEGANIVEEGAVRVAAIEKERFEVTHYLPIAGLKKDPQQADLIFPLEVSDKIRARLR